jgi:gamma-glutamylcyclotransferase (GGCT)/AIG2-like uncharacterized protein YtfP
MHAAFFAYGTLALPEVMQALTGRRFASGAAVLPGFARYRVRGRVYPGVVAEPGGETAGRLYAGLDAATLALLDRFEGELYERRGLPVRTGAGGSARAEVYVVRETLLGALSREPWSLEDFAARELARYLEACRAFHAAVDT